MADPEVPDNVPAEDTRIAFRFSKAWDEMTDAEKDEAVETITAAMYDADYEE